MLYATRVELGQIKQKKRGDVNRIVSAITIVLEHRSGGMFNIFARADGEKMFTIILNSYSLNPEPWRVRDVVEAMLEVAVALNNA